MQERIRQTFKKAVNLGIIMTIGLAVLVVYYEIADWMNVSVFTVFKLLAQWFGSLTLIDWILLLALKDTDNSTKQEVNPKASAKAVFILWLIIYAIFTALACVDGLMKVNFIRTVGAMIFVAAVCSLVAWLLAVFAINAQAKKET